MAAPPARRPLWVAVAFLTRLRVPGEHAEAPAGDGSLAPGDGSLAPGELRRASAWFPLVGLGVAGVGVAFRAAAEPLWGGAVATILGLAAMVAVTGALHEDGLADSADGLWGGWDPAGRLAIMRDSRIGTYGVVALVTVLSLRTALLLPLGLAGFARAVASAEVCSRAALLLVASTLPPARAGSGAQVAGPLPGRGVALAALVTAATLALSAGVWAPLPLLAGLLACGGCIRLFRRRLGGFTGDTLGAAQQLVALAVLAAMAALARGGLL
jgi:adenosylcobinamide-GDP ribazoletransferase